MLKYENKSNNEKIIIWVLFFKIFDNSLAGKNPPEEIIVKAKFNESKDLIDIRFKVINRKKVKPQYKKKILDVCFNISELLKDK